MFCSHAADFDTEEAYQAGYAKELGEIDALAAMTAGASDELGGMSFCKLSGKQAFTAQLRVQR
jgi:hypothetical protein